MPEQKQLGGRIVNAQPDIPQVEQQQHQGVDESEKHWRQNPIGRTTLLRVACLPMNL
jgi:hypothetical protein